MAKIIFMHRKWPLITQILNDKRDSIIEKWKTMILSPYPDETVRFLSTESNEFANPVGAIFSFAAEELFNQLIGDMNHEKIDEALDCILKIKFVQGNTLENAIDFIDKLKNAIIAIIGKNNMNIFEPEEYRELEENIGKIRQRGKLIFEGYEERVLKLKNKEENRIRCKNLKETRQNPNSKEETIFS